MYNFKKIEIQAVDGSKTEIDLSKEFAQIIYSQTENIAHLTVALDLYKHGEVERTEENEEVINAFKTKFFAYIQVGINKEMERDIVKSRPEFKPKKK